MAFLSSVFLEVGFEQLEHLLLTLFQLLYLLCLARSDLFDSLTNSFLDGLGKVWLALAEGHGSLHDFVLMLQLLLDSAEALLDLSLEILDGLLRVSREQTAFVFFFGLSDE